MLMQPGRDVAADNSTTRRSSDLTYIQRREQEERCFTFYKHLPSCLFTKQLVLMALSGPTGDGCDCEAGTRRNVSTAAQSEKPRRVSVAPFCSATIYICPNSIFITTQPNYIVTSAVSSSPTAAQSVTPTWQCTPEVLSCKGISLHI
jgi:hypothetical protein